MSVSRQMIDKEASVPNPKSLSNSTGAANGGEMDVEDDDDDDDDEL